MTQGRPLRHGRHVHHAERDADSGANNQRNENPLVGRHFGVEQRNHDGQCRTDFSGQNAPMCRNRRTQEFERKNEENGSDEVCKIEILLKRIGGHDFFDLPDLNMRSMRSVITNPPTMLLNEAATAIAPRTVVSVVSWRPAMMIAATTTMASRAFVRDMSGV